MSGINIKFIAEKQYLDKLETFSPVFEHEEWPCSERIESAAHKVDLQAQVKFSDNVPVRFTMKPRVQKPRDRTGEPEG